MPWHSVWKMAVNSFGFSISSLANIIKEAYCAIEWKFGLKFANHLLNKWVRSLCEGFPQYPLISKIAHYAKEVTHGRCKVLRVFSVSVTKSGRFNVLHLPWVISLNKRILQKAPWIFNKGLRILFDTLLYERASCNIDSKVHYSLFI